MGTLGAFSGGAAAGGTGDPSHSASQSSHQLQEVSPELHEAPPLVRQPLTPILSLLKHRGHPPHQARAQGGQLGGRDGLCQVGLQRRLLTAAPSCPTQQKTTWLPTLRAMGPGRMGRQEVEGKGGT